MRIDVRNIELDVTERRIIREALVTYIRDRNRKGQRSKAPGVSDNHFDNAARAVDLLKALNTIDGA